MGFKRFLYVLGTIIPVYLMLTVFMPPGFGGVPWMYFVFLAFFILFFALGFCEKSWFWNGIIAFIFWLPMIVLHLFYLGTENIQNGTVYIGLLGILGIALAHSIIQMGFRGFINLIFKTL